MHKADTAEALHRAGSSCSQAVFTAFAPDYGLDFETAHRLSTGLGAGFGRQQRLCGAISGSALVLGLALGSRSSADAEAKERTYAAVSAFIAQVESEFGAADCRKLLEGLDLNDLGQRAEVKARGLGDKVCNPIIRRCAELLEERLGAKP